MSDRQRYTQPLSGGIAAGASEVWNQVASIPNGETGAITAIRFMPATNVTAHDSNYADLSVEIAGTEVASEQTTTGDTGDLTAGTEIELALLSVSLEVSDGDLISVKKTHASSGAVLDGTVTIDVQLFRAA